MRLSLHIDRLVLDGIDVDPSKLPRLQAALEAELGRLLADGGVGAGLTSMPVVKAGGFEMSRGGSPVKLGRQIARSVHEGIGR